MPDGKRVESSDPRNGDAPGLTDPPDSRAQPERDRRSSASTFVRNGSFVRQAEALRVAVERSPAMFWSSRVNRRIGAMIALALLDTGVSSNMVSITGGIAHVAGAALVLASPVPAPPLLVLLVFLTWELGLSLDNADGQLARARSRPSAFGAWLDQLLDFANHTAVAASLSMFAARALELSAPTASLLTALAVAGSLIGLFASAQRNALMGARPAVAPGNPRVWRVLYLGRHLTDFGAVYAVASLGLVWPPVLLVLLMALPALIAASVVAQVVINWPRLPRG